MPLTAKGEEIKSAMTKEYGAKKGEEVFYASRNSGKITGVDEDRADTNAQSGTLPRTDVPNDISNLQVKLAEAIQLGNTDDEASLRSTIAAMDAVVAMDAALSKYPSTKERKAKLEEAEKFKEEHAKLVAGGMGEMEAHKFLSEKRNNRKDSLHKRLDTALALATKIDGTYGTAKRIGKNGKVEDVKVYIPTKEEASESAGEKNK